MFPSTTILFRTTWIFEMVLARPSWPLGAGVETSPVGPALEVLGDDHKVRMEMVDACESETMPLVAGRVLTVSGKGWDRAGSSPDTMASPGTRGASLSIWQWS